MVGVEVGGQVVKVVSNPSDGYGNLSPDDDGREDREGIGVSLRFKSGRWIFFEFVIDEGAGGGGVDDNDDEVVVWL